MSRYREIADALAREIRRGEYAPGAALPSEAELMGRFGTSRNTARRAIDALRREGLAITLRGRGSYVAARHAATALAEDLAELRGRERPEAQDHAEAAELYARGWRRIGP